MNINTNNSAGHIYANNMPPKPAAGEKADAAAKSGPAPVGQDKVELNALDKLRDLPDVRPEMVAKGKELLNDPEFPSKEMIDSIAKLIVPFDDE
ncbi:hypothetical protein MLD52_04900 [Puniceicoccaceae bacterium K14]|nr:hypothetical protein [Puniceicoccaceae bacterium K14]